MPQRCCRSLLLVQTCNRSSVIRFRLFHVPVSWLPRTHDSSKSPADGLTPTWIHLPGHYWQLVSSGWLVTQTIGTLPLSLRTSQSGNALLRGSSSSPDALTKPLAPSCWLSAHSTTQSPLVVYVLDESSGCLRLTLVSLFKSLMMNIRIGWK